MLHSKVQDCFRNELSLNCATDMVRLQLNEHSGTSAEHACTVDATKPVKTLACEAGVTARSYMCAPLRSLGTEACSARSFWLLRNVTGAQTTCICVGEVDGGSSTASDDGDSCAMKSQGIVVAPVRLINHTNSSDVKDNRYHHQRMDQMQWLPHTLARCLGVGHAGSSKQLHVDESNQWHLKMAPSTDSRLDSQSELRPDAQSILPTLDIAHQDNCRPSQARQVHTCTYNALKRARGRAHAFSVKNCSVVRKQMNPSGTNPPQHGGVHTLSNTTCATRHRWVSALTSGLHNDSLCEEEQVSR